MSIRVKGLTKVYGDQHAVNDISFDIEGGQVIGFLGPNGAGKSTTMKMISCYLEPTSGTAEVCGYDILENPIDVKRSIGYLPENNPLYMNMYVKEYLQLVCGLYNLNNKKSKVEYAIERVGLEKEQHKIIGSLSKGYKQRVGLAQAIMHDPQVYILDEPTSGLDMNQLIDIRALIKSLGEENTVILSTHIMQEVEAMCDRVLIINEGNLVANDSINDLRQKISGSRSLILETLEKNIDLSVFENITGVTSVNKLNGRIEINHSSKRDIRKDTFNTVVKNGWHLIYMQLTENNVEDIFHKYTMKKDA